MSSMFEEWIDRAEEKGFDTASFLLDFFFNFILINAIVMISWAIRI